MTLKDDLMGYVVTDVELDGADGDVVALTLSGSDGRQYTIELTTTLNGYPVLEVERVYG